MSLDVIYDLIVAAVPSVTARRAKQSAPAPTDLTVEYAELDSDLSHGVDAVDGELYADSSEPGAAIGTFDRNQMQQVPTTIQLDAYATDGRALLESVCIYARNELGRELLAAAGWAFVGAGSIRDLAFLGDTVWLPRFSVDVVFLRGVSRVDSLPAILHLRLGGELGNVESEIEVSPEEGV